MLVIQLHRVSTARQAKEERHSIPAQKKRTKDYVEKTDYLEEWKVYNISESAYTGKRKKFQPIIKDVKNSNGEIAIVVDCVDRFQRDFREAIIFDDLRKEGKCQLHFIQDNLVINKDSSNKEVIKWYELILDAKKYSAKISDNVQRGFEDKKDRGQQLGLQKLGYNKGQIFVKDPTRWDLVKKIFELYSTGKYSFRSLAEELANLGLKTRPQMGSEKHFPNGKPIDKNIVGYILKDRYYTGYVKNSEGEWIKGQHEPMITESLFEKCQKVMKSESRQFGKLRMQKRRFFLFRGLMKCGFCNSTITAQEQKGKHVYYMCSSKRNNGAKTCQQRTYKKDEVEKMFTNLVSQISVDDGAASLIRDVIGKEFDDDFAELKGREKVLKKRINEIDDELVAIGRKSLKGLLPDETVKRIVEENEEEKRKIKIQLQELEIKNPNCAKDIEGFINHLKNLDIKYARMNDSGKKELILSLGSKYLLNGNKTQFLWNSPFNFMVGFNNNGSHDRDA